MSDAGASVASAETTVGACPVPWRHRARDVARDGAHSTNMPAPRSTEPARSSNGDALRLRGALGGRDILLLVHHHEDDTAHDKDHGERRTDGDAGNYPDAEAVV